MSMLGVYVVMSAGMVVAFLTLIAEILWNRRAKQKLVNNTERSMSENHFSGNKNVYQHNQYNGTNLK